MDTGTRATSPPPTAANARQTALRLVLVLGVVSLFVDMTYEGARSINGPYLAVLGATGMVVGIVAGAGELIGYALRYWSGRMVDRTHRYWPIVFVGYAVNLLSAPALALTGRWLAAAVLWGIGMGAQESIMRAAVANMTPLARRGTAFGLFNMLFGVAWFAGSALMGLLYDVSIPALIVFSVAFQLTAIPFFFVAQRMRGAPKEAA